METILIVVIAIVGIWLIGKARNFGQSHIWGPLTDKLNEQTLKDLEELKEDKEGIRGTKK